MWSQVSTDLPNILTGFGVATPIVGVLLWLLIQARSDLKESRAEIREAYGVAQDKFLPAALSMLQAHTETVKAMSEVTETMQAATVMMHTLAGRPALDATQFAELLVLLRELRERRP